MSDIRGAILRGTDAAAKVHRELGARDRLEASGNRVDVFAAFAAKDIPLLLRPLDGLLGAYLKEPSPGVIVSTKRPLSVQRFTAAHELGHFVLDHNPSLDDEGLLRRTPFSGRPSYDLQELEADAFASTLLLPMWLFREYMRRYGWTRSDFEKPEVVYQLALRAGASYEATCFALKQHRAIDDHVCQQLLDSTRKSLKQRLLQGHTPENWYPDVWLLTERDSGAPVLGSRGDFVQFQLLEHSNGGFLWDVSTLANAGFQIISDAYQSQAQEVRVGATATRTITARSTVVRLGHVTLAESRPWLAQGQPLHEFEFSFAFADPSATGLVPAMRERRLKVA